jgi:hypothetical protein
MAANVSPGRYFQGCICCASSSVVSSIPGFPLYFSMISSRRGSVIEYPVCVSISGFFNQQTNYQLKRSTQVTGTILRYEILLSKDILTVSLDKYNHSGRIEEIFP